MQKHIIGVLSSCLMVTGAYAATKSPAADHQATMQYKNQRGSTMTMQMSQTGNNSGTISGTFTTAVATKMCHRVIGKPVPITGYYTGNAFSISISYPVCGATVAMIGNFDAQRNFQAMWLDAHQSGRSDNSDLSARLIGQDQFQRIG